MGRCGCVQRHEFAFYPQRVGEFEIPPFEVRYGIAGKPGDKPTAKRELTKAIHIAAAMPPGAEGFHRLISAPDLSVTETWTPEVTGEQSFTAGNANQASDHFPS